MTPSFTITISNQQFFFYYVRLEILYEYRESTRVSFPSQLSAS